MCGYLRKIRVQDLGEDLLLLQGLLQPLHPLHPGQPPFFLCRRTERMASAAQTASSARITQSAGVRVGIMRSFQMKRRPI